MDGDSFEKSSAKASEVKAASKYMSYGRRGSKAIAFLLIIWVN